MSSNHRSCCMVDRTKGDYCSIEEVAMHGGVWRERIPGI